MSALSDRLLENLGNGVGFWELKGRPIYNGVLGLVCGYHAIRGDSLLLRWSDPDNLTAFLSFVIVANVVYCAAYVPDQAIQLTPYREGWKRWRWLLLSFGTFFASLLAHAALAGLKSV